MFGPMVGASLHVSGVSPLQLDDIEEHFSPGNLAKLRIHGKGDLVRTFDLTT